MTSLRAMTLGYLSALGLLVLLSFGSYWIMQEHIKRQDGDAALVNISGRQRMLSQRIAMLSLHLSQSRDKKDRDETRKYLKEAILLMERSHSQLINEEDPNLPHRLSGALKKIYFSPPSDLDKQVRDYLSRAEALAQTRDGKISEGDPDLRRMFAAASDRLIAALDAAVGEFQKEEEKRVEGLKRLENWVLAAILAVLLLTGVLIFRPMVRRVAQEQEALNVLNKTLEQRVVERSDQIARMRDRFIHNVNHELRTPISCVIAALKGFAEDVSLHLAPKQKKLLDIALRNTKHLTMMIEDLLAVAGAEEGKLAVEPREVSVSESIAEAIESLRLVAAPKGILLHGDVPRNLPPAHADPARVRQILANIIGNAIKFTPQEGKIEVKAGVFDEDPQLLFVSVSDTGPGIRAEDAEAIFERLYQAADRGAQAGHKGLGLGLFICKDLVTRQGGKIWVRSQPGKGSTFFFTLPIFKAVPTKV